jgi:hypothetical protein
MAGELFSRFQREKKTIGAMIELHCHDTHDGTRGLCDECGDLEGYAFLRLDKCPFGDAKPTCAKCVVHCYKPGMRERIKQVMRYSGPKMTFRHPILALFHAIDSYIYKPRRKPVHPPARAGLTGGPAKSSSGP